MEKHGTTWRRQIYGTLWWEFWNGKHDSSWGASFVKYNFTNFKLRHDRTTWRANGTRFALALILYLGYSTLYWHQVACCSWAIPSQGQAMVMTVVNCQAIYPPFILQVWWCPFWRVLIDQSRKVCLLVYGVALTAIYPLFILPCSVMLSFFRMHINQSRMVCLLVTAMERSFFLAVSFTWGNTPSNFTGLAGLLFVLDTQFILMYLLCPFWIHLFYRLNLQWFCCDFETDYSLWTGSIDKLV